MNFIEKIKKRYKRIVYTLRHKKAFLKIEKKLLGKNTLKGFFHDWDKPFLYCLFWISNKKIQKIHQQISRHHVDNHLLKTKADLVETVIDWECARFTKPDKPLDAYETLIKFYPEYESVYLPIILELLPHEVPTQKVIQHQVNKNQVQKIKQNQR